MTHPLTDEICRRIKMKLHYGSHRWSRYQDMRAAADWQLEQVIEWLKKCPNYDLETYTGLADLIHDLKKAMRPQEES